jgi:undecaprenyl-diphosphatase
MQFVKYLFNMQIRDDSYLFFELICNVGTILAALIFLRKEIFNLFLQDRKGLLFIFLAILPLIPIYFFFRPLITLLSSQKFLGFFFILTAVFLFTAALKNKEKTSSFNRKMRDVLFIGFMQTLALIPGISRSGSTISAGCIRGWNIKEAISFSFILAIPTILGGNMLEAIRIYKSSERLWEMPSEIYIVGFLTSFIFGLLTIRYIFSISSNKKLLPFAWYCLAIGILSSIYFNLF